MATALPEFCTAYFEEIPKWRCSTMPPFPRGPGLSRRGLDPVSGSRLSPRPRHLSQMMQQGAAVEPWRTHGPVLRPYVCVCVCVCARVRRCRLSAALKGPAPCEDELQSRILLISLNPKVCLSLSSFPSRACVCLCVYVHVYGGGRTWSVCLCVCVCVCVCVCNLGAYSSLVIRMQWSHGFRV